MKKISVVFISVLICLIAKDAFCDLRFQGNVALSDRELLRVIEKYTGTWGILTPKWKENIWTDRRTGFS